MAMIENFPMDSVIPFACLYMIVDWAETFEVKEQYITMGFNLYHVKMLTDRQNNMLKEISQDLYNERNHEGLDSLVQLSVDDNLFNSLSSVFTSIDKSFSLRDMMK